MFDLIYNKAINTIKEHNMLEDCETVIAGVSGGADSLCLLIILKKICNEQGIKLVAAHVNHMLRRTEADEDEQFVLKLCNDSGIDCRVLRKNVTQYAREKRIGAEEAGRDVRYEFFQKLAAEFNKAKIAVAHNKNDRAETVMSNILRGSGLQGLRGIPYTRDNVIRPLLDVTRKEIEEFLQTQGISPRIDSSNYENIYNRNKIRNELFPYINEKFGIDITDSLIRLSSNVSGDNEYLVKISLEHYKNLSHNEGGKIIIPVKGLLSLDSAIVNRILNMAALDLYVSIGMKKHSLERVHVDQIVSLMKNSESGRVVCMPGGIRVKKEFGVLIFFTEKNDDAISYEYIIHDDKVKNTFELQIPEVNCRAVFRLSSKVNNNFSQKDYEQCFDYDNICRVSNRTGFPFVVRNRRSGDYMLPLKGLGKCKLKKFFIDNKVPADIRNKLPLLAIGNEVIWIPGMRSSENFKAEKTSDNILIVSIFFDNNNQEVLTNEK